MSEAARLAVVVEAQDQTKGVFARVDGELQKLATSGTSAGRALVSMGGQVAAVGAVIGGVVVAGVGKAVSVFADFEHGMSAVKAASGASAAEMAQLGTAAIALGQDTTLAGISATDAATAMEELAKGGVSVADQLGGATKGALLLASAGQIAVGEAAGIATKAMNIFSLTGADVAHVADLMSAGANKSATDVGQLGAAFNQSAAVAKNAGLSIEELTGTLAFLAQRGLEGSDAGTSLKTALLALQAPTKIASKTMEELGINVRDAQGNMLPFADIADVLRDRLKNLSAEQRDAALKTIFGNDAIRVGIALYEGGGAAIRDWTANVNDAGNAARTGAIKNDNLAGSLDQLKAVFETAAIQVGAKFAPAVRTAADELGKFVTKAMASPEVTKALEDLGNKGAAALTSLIAKVSDPGFQRSLKEWGTAALDVGRALVSLAGDVAGVLGPPLKAAVGWFADLDEQGKKNVIAFALVAGAAVKFRDELGTVKTVVYDVIKAFAAKEAAKKSLQAANEGLAGSAGRTATAMTAVRAAAAAAAPVIADVAVVTAASGVAAVGVTTGFAALANAMDQSGQRALDNTQAWDAASFAIANGGTAANGAIDGFTRLVVATGEVNPSVARLSVLWNQYVASLQAGGQSTEAVGLHMINLAQFITGQVAPAFEGVNNTAQPFNNTLVGLGSAAMALGNSLPAMGSGLAGAATGFAASVTSAQTLNAALSELEATGTVTMRAFTGNANAALAWGQAIAAANAPTVSTAAALSDLNTFGTSAQQGLNAAAGAALSAAMAFDQTNDSLSRLGQQSGQLGGYLHTLQAEWDALDTATKAQGNTTAAQAARYAELAPAIQYLNAQLGVNKDNTIAATLAAVGNLQAVNNANGAYTAAQAAVQGHTGALAGNTTGYFTATGAAQANTAAAQANTAATLTSAQQATAYAVTLAGQAAGQRIAAQVAGTHTTAINATAAAAGTGQTAANNYTAALNAVPKTVTTTVTTPGVIDGTISVNNLTAAIGDVPRSFTVTANVDISGALAAINTLNNNMPHSPAKEGPFRTLPDWDALFESFPGAVQGAIGQFQKFGAGVKQALNSLSLGNIAQDIGGNGNDSIATIVKRFAANFAVALDTMKATASAAGDFLAEAQAYKSLILLAVTAIREAQAALNTVNFGGGGLAIPEIKRGGENVGNSLTEGIKRSLDIHSPSQVMAAIGKDVIDGLVQGMSDAQQDAAKQAADVASAVAKAIQDTLSAATALGKLDVATLPTGGQITGILGFARALVAEMAAASTMLNEDGIKQTSLFADAAGKVASAISATLGALGGLVNYVPPVAANIYAFGKTLRLAVNDLTVLAAEIPGELAASAATFAEQSAKAIAVYGTGADAFGKLRDYAQIGAASIYAFGKDLRLAVQDLAALVDIIGQEMADKAGAFGEQIGKATGGIAGAVAGFVALRDYVRVPAAALYGFGKDLLLLVQDFAAIVDVIGVEMLTKAGQLGEAVGKITGSIAGAVAGFAALKDYVSPAYAAMQAFVADTRALVTLVIAAAQGFATDGLKAASDFADTAGKALGLLASGVAGFLALDKLVAPSQASMDLFARSAVALVVAIQRASAGLAGDGLKAAGEFADTAGKVLGIVANGVTGLKDLITFVAPAQSAMDAFATAVRDMMATLARLAGTVATEGASAAATFAEAVGKVFAGLNAGTSFFKSLDNILLPDQGGIDRILAPILATVGAVANAARAFDPATLGAATAFADAFGSITGNIQAGNNALLGAGGGGGGAGGTTQIIFNGPIYGTAEFDQRIQQALVALDRTGAR